MISFSVEIYEAISHSCFIEQLSAYVFIFAYGKSDDKHMIKVQIILGKTNINSTTKPHELCNQESISQGKSRFFHLCYRKLSLKRAVNLYLIIVCESFLSF